MKKIFSTVLLCTVYIYSFSQTGISVGNARIFFHSKNLKTTDKLYLSNTSKDTTIWQLSLMDWDRDSAGTKRYYNAGTLANSCAPNITISPGIVTILPNTTSEVLVSFNHDSVSRTAATSLNAMIMINEADVMVNKRRDQMTQSGVIVKTQIGVHVYYVTDEGAKDINLVDVKYSVDSPSRITTTVKNLGLQPLDTKVRIEISNTETGEEWTLKDRTCATLPGAVRKEIFELPQLNKGKYLSIAIVDSGPDMPVKVGEVNFIVK